MITNDEMYQEEYNQGWHAALEGQPRDNPYSLDKWCGVDDGYLGTQLQYWDRGYDGYFHYKAGLDARKQKDKEQSSE